MKNKKVLIIIIAIIVVVAIVVGVGVVNSRKPEEGTPGKQQGTSGNENNNDEGTETSNKKNSLIDMENVENVKVENGSKINNSKDLLKEKTLLGLKFTNIRLAAENGLTNFTADVENVSGKDFTGRAITIIFKKSDGTEYSRLNGYLPNIPNGKSNKLDASTTADLSNAYDFVIE